MGVGRVASPCYCSQGMCSTNPTRPALKRLVKVSNGLRSRGLLLARAGEGVSVRALHRRGKQRAMKLIVKQFSRDLIKHGRNYCHGINCCAKAGCPWGGFKLVQAAGTPESEGGGVRLCMQVGETATLRLSPSCSARFGLC